MQTDRELWAGSPCSAPITFPLLCPSSLYSPLKASVWLFLLSSALLRSLQPCFVQFRWIALLSVPSWRGRGGTERRKTPFNWMMQVQDLVWTKIRHAESPLRRRVKIIQLNGCECVADPGHLCRFASCCSGYLTLIALSHSVLLRSVVLFVSTVHRPLLCVRTDVPVYCGVLQ